MKMTKDQYKTLTDAIDNKLHDMNLTRKAICRIGDCWILLTRFLVETDHPIGYGTTRDWLFPDLNDSHIDTAFRKMMKEVGKVI
jgi:hypothetical protein